MIKQVTSSWSILIQLAKILFIVRVRQEAAHGNKIIEYKWRVGYDARSSWRQIVCGTFRTLA